jgi:hypothetical protein
MPESTELYREAYRGSEFVITHHPAVVSGYGHAAHNRLTLDGGLVHCPIGDVAEIAKKTRARIDIMREDETLLPRLIRMAASSPTGHDVPPHIGGEFRVGDTAWAWALGGRVRRGLVVKVTRTRVTIAYTTPSSRGVVYRKAVKQEEAWREKAAPAAVSAIADTAPDDAGEPLPAKVAAAAPGEVVVTPDGPAKLLVWMNQAVLGVVFDESAARLERGAYAAWSPRGGRDGVVGFYGTPEAAGDAIAALYRPVPTGIREADEFADAARRLGLVVEVKVSALPAQLDNDGEVVVSAVRSVLVSVTPPARPDLEGTTLGVSLNARRVWGHWHLPEKKGARSKFLGGEWGMLARRTKIRQARRLASVLKAMTPDR